MRSHMMFQPRPFTFSFIPLPNEEEKENVQKLKSFSKQLIEKKTGLESR